jgi:uncharacterized repeat protein (TIGR03803 family)
LARTEFLSGCGVMFALDPGTGTETVLYSFCSQSNCTDGANPYGTLVDVKGTLYGATSAGGTQCIYLLEGCGVVFAVDANTGKETMIYTFCNQPNCTDGGGPNGLIDVRGTLYGTTSNGGAVGGGTVFTLTKR